MKSCFLLSLVLFATPSVTERKGMLVAEANSAKSISQTRIKPASNEARAHRTKRNELLLILICYPLPWN